MLRDEIRERLMPELGLVTREGDQDLILDIFEEAAIIGGWDKKGLDNCDMAGGGLGENCPETIFDHCKHTAGLCSAAYEYLKPYFAKVGPCDRDELLLGGFLHDVGKLIENDYIDGKHCHSESCKFYRHPTTGAYLAKKHGCSDTVVHAILTHSVALSPEGEHARRTPESLIIYHLDEICFFYADLYYKMKKEAEK